MKVLESKMFPSLCFVLVINWMEAVRLYEETGDNAGSLNLGKIKVIYLVRELPEASAAPLLQREERSPVSSVGAFACARSSLRGRGRLLRAGALDSAGLDPSSAGPVALGRAKPWFPLLAWG